VSLPFGLDNLVGPISCGGAALLAYIVLIAGGALFMNECNPFGVSTHAPAPAQHAASSPTFVSFTNTFNASTFTTDFTIEAKSPDGSPLAYVWSLPVVGCGYLTHSESRGNTNGYYHGPDALPPNGCPPPPGIEIETIVQVLVAKASDLDAHGNPKPGAYYFIYEQVARAWDSPDTVRYLKNVSLRYYPASNTFGKIRGDAEAM
jgi:hypothetical protein